MNGASLFLQNAQIWQGLPTVTFLANQQKYIDVRARLLGMADKVKEQVIVDDERHPLYPIVREFGGAFTDHNGEILEAEEQQ